MNPVFDSKILKFYIALFLRAMLLLSPVILLFYQENGLTVQDLFFFQGIFYLTSIMSEVPVGYLSDNISRKSLLLLSFVIFFSITMLWLFARGYWVVLAGEMLFGISKVMMDNAMSGYLYDYLDTNGQNNKMINYYGYLNFFLALGTALAALFGTWMYTHFGSAKILICEMILILISITLTISLPKIKPAKTYSEQFSHKIQRFLAITKNIYNNKYIKYYIYYSGILTSTSILLALSFQPIMQNAVFPIFLFGVIAFFNHGIRAFAAFFAGKQLKSISIKKFVIPLFILYVLAFVFIFKTLTLTSISMITFLLFLICLIIGVQLIFTILHISRLHKFVSIENRGSLMAVNNLVSRVMAVIVLVSSKLFISRLGLGYFFIIAFCVFLIISSYLIVKIYKEAV